MRTPIKILTLLLFGSILFIIVIYNYSNWKSYQKNGFSRYYVDVKLTVIKSVNLLPNTYEINNLTANEVILNEIRMPAKILKIPINLKTRINVSLVKPPNFQLSSISTYSDNRTFLFSGKDGTALDVNSRLPIKLDNVPFYQAEVTKSKAFIIQGIKIDSNKNSRRVLKKISSAGKVENTFIMDKQIDGYFDSDGLFYYDSATDMILYMYFYRGEFICFDSKLIPIYHAKTIDTITKAKLNGLKRVRQRNKYGVVVEKTMQSGPPFIVNRRMCISNDKVYLHSYLKSDNEDLDVFKTISAIDVYELKSGKYLLSFKLPQFDGQKLRFMKIYNQVLVGLYENALVIYKFPKMS